MSSPDPSVSASPRLLQHRSFVLFWCARTSTVAAYMMQTVAVGWQMYELTGSAFDLGLVGLVQFAPMILLTLVIGQVIDSADRRVVARTCQIVKACAVLTLALGSYQGWLTRESILSIMFVTGIARAFETPTLLTMVPGLVPPLLLPRAIAASASANQAATICGPAIGGVIYLLGPTVLYCVCAGAFVMASVLISLIRIAHVPSRKQVTLETLFAGLGYIRSRPIVFGAISLDLFVVLFGTVISLLPVFARDVLQTDASGLGLLRSAPAIGALLVTIVLSRRTIDHRVGPILFITIGLFGASILVFAFSTSILLSMAALAIYGASDAVSVVIRHSLVQLRTPDDMMGRVLSINSLFTGTSSTLGEFRAGVVAALFGAVPAVVLGGVAALVVAGVWMRLFPDLIKTDRMQPREKTPT